MRAAADLAEPPPDRRADEWADQERILPPDSPEPGQWRSSRIPYFIPVMQAFSDPATLTIVGACGSQMGKTEIQFNILGHRFCDGPYVPALFIGATEKMVRSISKDRFNKMVTSTPALARILDKSKAGNNILEKFFANVRLGFAWAGSATELSSHPAGLILLDELDRMNTDVANEGDPVMLARARTKNYSGAKIGIFSTPTIEGASAIWKHWSLGTMGKWQWPCPHCAEYFVPCFELLRWPKGASVGEIQDGARVVCPSCGGEIENRHKLAMNQAGRYLYHTPNPEEGGDPIPCGTTPPRNPTASFWVSGLASPWQSFGDIAVLYSSAARTKNPATIQAVLNTYLGELYRESGDAPSKHELARWIDQYNGQEPPPGVQLITMGVDVQGDGLYFAVWGWGFNSELWLLKHAFLSGQTEYPAVWDELKKEIEADYQDKKIDRVFVDSGFRPGTTTANPDHAVYKFCRDNLGLVFPVKGQPTMEKAYKASRIDVTLSGKTLAGGLMLYHCHTHYYKQFLYGRIRWPIQDTGPGRLHLPRNTTPDFLDQLVSEELIMLPTGKPRWRAKGPNHYLDCSVYAACAASSLYVHNLKPIPDQEPPASQDKPPEPGPYIPKRKGGWIRR